MEKLRVSERSIPEKEDLKKWDHVDGLEFPSIEDRNVLLPIGADIPEAFWVMDEKHGNRGEPCAIKSPLGWTLIGPTASFKGETEKNVNFIRIEDDQLQLQLEMF